MTRIAKHGRGFLRASLIVTTVLALTGCSAMHTAIKKRDLEVQTKMSETVFLEPVSPEKKVIYVSVRNTSDRDLDAKPDIIAAIQGAGYRITQDPEEAQFMLQANILQFGKSDLRSADAALRAGFGGAAAGVALAAASGTDGRGAVTGGLIGAAIGVVSDALVEDVLYSAITDLQVRERPLNGEVITQTQATNANQGTSTKLKQQVSGGEVNWKTYRTRILSTANKVNLEFEEAQPELRKGLAKAIAGVFAD